MGLNILAYNDVDVPAEQDPRFVFLRSLSEHAPCSAHVGSLALKDMVDTPEELFGPPDGDLPYVRTKVGLYDVFYDLREYPCYDACFFPEVTAPFWRIQYLDNRSGIERLIDDHALALYVGATGEALARITPLLQAPFPGEEQWVGTMTQLYPLVVVVGHDGLYIEAYASDASHFALLEPALAQATEGIRAHPWFRENEGKLEWEEDPSLCLILQER
jgi:hypothetical protein